MRSLSRTVAQQKLAAKGLGCVYLMRTHALRKALALERSHGAEAVTKEENERLRSEVTQMRAQVEPLLCDHICKPTSVTTSVTTSVNPHL